ncbi:MAG: hypothetical protein A3B91_02370 [Candidatus Yanofskybacteria bacterium RIFCSPHIGHO2_02_FULL_41_29]|uniref:Uncharacterized protein n=1 Tax=Candidatus Yanofskybacteria bacterium RIFCSPHIGHO2_01_FULL_41_53 TaxID=1802663 RepID=A0A1F8EFY4_9BACT|nr:MAG: hypothetical protein A2650_04770 [Candidatus Yanofskybacteria bacterium RIFCSPHIGHO2_01_FULL_41_53]OGN12369.1 MAG: hypothetical protein A3B91_02370 [Candidatus Yanofskybacteria bacterium RIFCSPHIGHO2_02_FULL_41_29]OGN16857.1 MAG: hypothetical protein A3F48_00065 [Candidatus Yanofskybacteria bacterium RIFCSPHIGHO2_12_FULL_41_9]OGN23235.1 MAG: hypothetical protein A2916_02785 [Candidatus Yanofskybacteria bacterium RIFCSPLOWO2_01_FULL_41_67]OGN28868.1 MAG: hypothetical protein A3H54_01855 
MQKIATKVFVWASIAFAIIGMLMVLTTSPTSNGPNVILLKLLFTTVIVILTSFALSIASKYLNGKS